MHGHSFLLNLDVFPEWPWAREKACNVVLSVILIVSAASAEVSAYIGLVWLLALSFADSPQTTFVTPQGSLRYIREDKNGRTAAIVLGDAATD